MNLYYDLEELLLEVLEKDIIDNIEIQEASNQNENYTFDHIFSLASKMLLENKEFISKLEKIKKLNKLDVAATYSELELRIGFIGTFFYTEFIIKNKTITGEGSQQILNGFSPMQIVENIMWLQLQNFLPKRISKEFKINYPNITAIIDTGKDWNKRVEEVEIERLTSKKIPLEFLPTYQNAASNELMNNAIPASKKAKASLTGDSYSYKYKSIKMEEGQITIDLNALTDFTGKKAPIITDGHKKAFFFACHLLNRSKDPFCVFFPYNEFLELKGIATTGKNRMILKQQLKELNSLFWDIKDKKGKWKGNVRLLTIDKSTSKGAFIRFGEWVDDDFSKTFALIDKKAYAYNEPKAAIGGAFTISQKLSMDVFLNWTNPKRNNNGVFSIKVENLVSLLGFSDDIYSKKGFTYVKERLEEFLDSISIDEGLQWQYRNVNHTSKDEFLNDYIEYKHDRLLKIYIESSNK